MTHPSQALHLQLESSGGEELLYIIPPACVEFVKRFRFGHSTGIEGICIA